MPLERTLLTLQLLTLLTFQLLTLSLHSGVGTSRAVVPCFTVLAELPLQHDAAMNATATPQSTDDPMLLTARSGDLPSFVTRTSSYCSSRVMRPHSSLPQIIPNFNTSRLQQTDGSPTSSICTAERQLRKLFPLSASDERIQDGLAVRNIHTGILYHNLKPEEYALIQYLNSEDELTGDSNQH